MFVILRGLALVLLSVLGSAREAHALSSDVVISQVYGGGGNSGAIYRNDFIELFNRGSDPVNLAGWSVQYASSTGSTWQVTNLTGTLQPGHYFLIQEAAGAGVTQNLPTPDATGNIAMAAASGKVLLASTTTASSGSCPSGVAIVDLVGYGAANCFEASPTPGLSNTTAALRLLGGCAETDDNAADFNVGAPTPRNSATLSQSCVQGGDCSAVDTPIGQIQGSGLTAALTGTRTVQGVVVADFEYPGSGAVGDYLRGFYLQNTPDSADGDALTSDAIFVFDSSANSVSLGQIVQVTGNVTEFNFNSTGGTLTEMTAASIVVCGTGGSITPVNVALPVAAPDDWERYEGMLVSFAQPLFVTEHFELGRFGHVELSGAQRLPQPTNIAEPGAGALAQQAQNDRNRILLDDDLQNQNADPIRFGRDGAPLSASNTLRGGDSLQGLTGVLTQSDATTAPNASSATDPVLYRVRPFNVLNGSLPNFQPANARPSVPPALGGRLRVAGFNLLNYFNTFGSACTFGVGGGAADCRGADNATEFERQSQKTVQAALGTGADILVVSELENDGYGPSSAIVDLTNRLNAAAGPGTWSFIDADARTGELNALGVDAIKVAMLYQPSRVTPVGQTAVANTGAFGLYQLTSGPPLQRSRPALAQAFQEATGTGRVVLVGNHLKSKGSGCADNVSPVGPDPDANDGQGNCNLTRTAAAEQLGTWLASNPTGTGESRILILGDMNAYAREDPIQALESAGYTDLIQSHLGAAAYSYVFDGQWGYLDHALASPSLVSQIAAVVEWHINADEPNALDYNTEFKSAGQLTSLYAPDSFRASDHDPVLVGLNLNPSRAAAVPGLGGAGSRWGLLLLLGGCGLWMLKRSRRQSREGALFGRWAGGWRETRPAAESSRVAHVRGLP